MTTETHPTKERLLDAAELLFAERGFDGVSIRDLCSAAEVNVAAVNYHFQGKENLYTAVLSRRVQPIRERMLAALTQVSADNMGSPDLETLIRTFVSTYLQDALVRPDGDTFLRLMARQIHDPRYGGETFFRELVVPIHRAFAAALAESNPDLNPAHILWIIASIVGQVIHFVLRWRRGNIPGADDSAGTIPRDLFPPLTDSLDVYIRQVVDHVTRFSVGGIEACAKES